MHSRYRTRGQASQTCGLAVHNLWLSAGKAGQTTTTSQANTFLCAQNTRVIRRNRTYRPLVFHASSRLNTSGAQALIPTIHTTYDKQNEVYIK